MGVLRSCSFTVDPLLTLFHGPSQRDRIKASFIQPCLPQTLMAFCLQLLKKKSTSTNKDPSSSSCDNNRKQTNRNMWLQRYNLAYNVVILSYHWVLSLFIIALSFFTLEWNFTFVYPDAPLNCFSKEQSSSRDEFYTHPQSSSFGQSHNHGFVTEAIFS